MLLGDKDRCGICGTTLPHPRLTCSQCGQVYDDCEDSSGPAHSRQDCLTHMKDRLDRAEYLLSLADGFRLGEDGKVVVMRPIAKYYQSAGYTTSWVVSNRRNRGPKPRITDHQTMHEAVEFAIELEKKTRV